MYRTMKRTITALALAALVPAVAAAQGRPVVEIGTNLGLAVANAQGSTSTHIGLPGEGLLGQPAIYASFFPVRGKVMVQPQLAFNRFSSEGDSFTTVGIGSDLGYLFSGARRASPYVAATGGYQSISGEGASENDFAAGARLGYRMVVGNSVGVRFETGYRRWFDSEVNEFSVGVGIGGIIRKG